VNNFAELSDGDSTEFLVRWRGRQEGPYTAAVIEAKLAANQIGMLHEIAHNGQWITLRDYFAEREAVLRAERQAREEQERRAREEAERQAREREEQLRAVLATEGAATDGNYEKLPVSEIQNARQPTTTPRVKWPWVILVGVLALVLSASSIPEGSALLERLVISVGLLVAASIYFIPSIVALANKNPNGNSILVLNLFLGWTFIGWVVALAWACKES
jgi:hypothetical protein